MAEAVEAGDIDQEQAGQILAKLTERFLSDEFGTKVHDGSKGHKLFDRGEQAEVLAETLGLSVEELKEAHQAGQTLRDIAEAQSVAWETVTTALIDAAESRLAEAVEAGDIDQEQADQILAKLTERFLSDEFSTKVHDGSKGHKGSKGAQVIDRADMVQLIADALGVSVEDLQAARAEGQTLQDMAEANELDWPTVEVQVIEGIKTQLAEAVTAGEITQAQADRMIERLEERGLRLEVGEVAEESVALGAAVKGRTGHLNR